MACIHLRGIRFRAPRPYCGCIRVRVRIPSTMRSALQSANHFRHRVGYTCNGNHRAGAESMLCIVTKIASLEISCVDYFPGDTVHDRCQWNDNSITRWGLSTKARPLTYRFNKSLLLLQFSGIVCGGRLCAVPFSSLHSGMLYQASDATDYQCHAIVD